MKRYFFLLIAVLFLGSCYSPLTDVTPQNGEPVRLFIPLYSYPTDNDGEYWYAVAEAADLIPITVIWGMIGTSDTEFYRQWLGVLRRGQNIELLCYVATTDGQRDIDSVKAKLRFYAETFDIDGVFFDEVSHSDDKIEYYRQIVDYARSFPKVKKVVLNSPYAPANFADTTGADIVLFYENTGKYWDEFDWQEYAGLSPDKKAAIVSGVLLKTRMKTVIEQAVIRGFGYIYVTNRGYDKLPTYWDQEVELLNTINVLQ